MQKFILAFFLPVFILLTAAQTLAQTQYTLNEISKHNTVNDCWMIFENKVYSFPASYINNHENKYMDIASWCGKDMTQDFKTKAGAGRDHKSFSYSRLEQYVIGTVSNSSQTPNSNNNTNTSDTEDNVTPKNNNPYNFWLPVVLGYGSYTLYWAFTKIPSLKKYRIFNKNIFNLFFNTLMLLCLLIPIAGFGYFMIARYSYESLRDIDFDFLFWHVEFGVFFVGLMLGHFLSRFKLYKAPLRLFFKRKPNQTTQVAAAQ